ncbi:MAG TPA: glycosyltransferase family 39 protein [Candidatus Polarisedimenticolia bacterium]|nr:glycosyltransferase family 39 protein [Candidatus Polarisedimenticolia bacterium]
MTTSKPQWRTLRWLPGILLAAAALLRFSALTRQSLWLDEILSMRGANRILTLDLASELFNRHGPLYFYLVAPILAMGGSEAGVRGLSALLGVGLVGAVYLLGRDLVDRRIGLAAGAAAAFSPFAVWYSQEARYVSLYLLLAAVSLWSAYRFSRDEGARYGVIHVVSTLLMLFAFPAGIFVSLGENLWLLASRPGSRKVGRWLLLQGLIGLVFLPWLMAAYDLNPVDLLPGQNAHSLSEISTGSPRALRLVHLPYPLFVFGAGLTIGPSSRDLHEDTSLAPFGRKPVQVAWGVLVPGALVLMGAAALLRRAPAAGALLILSVGASIVGPFLVARFTRVAYNVRYTAGALPAYLVLLGAGCAWAAGRRPWGWVLVAAFAGLVAFSLTAYFSDSCYFRDDSRGAAKFVSERIRPGEPLAVGAEERAFVHYFRGPITSWRRWRIQPAGSERAGELHDDAGRFWVAANRVWEEARFQEFLSSMRACFLVEQETELPGYRIYVFRLADDGARRCSLTYQHGTPLPDTTTGPGSSGHVADRPCTGAAACAQGSGGA